MPGKPQKFLIKRKVHQLFKLFPSIKQLDFKRLIAWAIIALQVMLPVNLAFAPALAAKHMQPGRVATVPYTLGPGETPTILAERYSLSIEELKELNQFRIFAKSFELLATGDDIDVPRPQSAFFNPVAGTTTSSALDNDIAALARSGGTMLSAQDSADTAMSMARSHMASAVGQSAKHWLDQFGTARLELNFNNKFQLDHSALDLLIPLYENEDALIYTQGGMRNKDQRNTGNIGAGVRAFHGEWMYGINTFYDNDFTGNNRRGGIGGEAWTHHLKLSANSYFRLSSWRQSRDFTDYDERPANGFDLRAEAFLPTYPHLGGKLIYENYRGDEVALFSKNDRQKNPSALTAGLSYTPIPLLTFGGEHRIGAGGRNNSSIHVLAQYRLGESWRAQIDPARVAEGRTLAGSRYDLVERNNHIVLEYKKRDVIQLRMPKQVDGNGGQRLAITAQVTAGHGLDRIVWDAADVMAAGGSYHVISPAELLITLPPYMTGDATNHYVLGATAYDKKGNASNRTSTTLSVVGIGISVAATSSVATPDTLPADGVSTSLLTIHLKDDEDHPLTGHADALTLTTRFEPDISGSSTAARTASSREPIISEITETDVGMYSAMVTAGNDPGQMIITPVIQGQQLTPILVGLQDNVGDLDRFDFLLSSETLAVGSGNATLTLTVMDADGKFLSGLGERVQFVAFPPEGITITATEETGDKYIAALSGTAAGMIKVSPVINGRALSALDKTLTLLPGAISERLSSFTMSKDNLNSDGRDSVILEVIMRDEYDNAIDSSGAITFNPSPAGRFRTENLSVGDGIHRVSLVGWQPGDFIITPAVNSVAFASMAKSLSLRALEIDAARSSFTLSQTTLLADDTETATLTFSAKDALGDALTGLSEVIAFSASPNEGVRFSDISETNGVYSATISGNKPGNISVMPSLYEAGMPSLAKDIAFTPTAVNISLSFDKTRAKADGQIVMLIDATNADGSPATDFTLEIMPQTAHNRQNGAERNSLLFNGLSGINQRMTTSDGKISVNITDPLGRGLKSTFKVSCPIGQKVAGEVIFTVPTSPDTTHATYFGHMAESTNGLRRPKLRGETGGESVLFNNEDWAVETYQVAKSLCGLAPIATLITAYDAMKANNWPLLPTASGYGFIWSNTETAMMGAPLGVAILSTGDGSRTNLSQSDGTRGLVVCVD